ncbi:hypothetical protein PCC9214_03870 [Planktothrix tepida]|nr:hypothetical protein PCC9214_03870 [Planktothrix tepida]
MSARQHLEDIDVTLKILYQKLGEFEQVLSFYPFKLYNLVSQGRRICLFMSYFRFDLQKHNIHIMLYDNFVF